MSSNITAEQIKAAQKVWGDGIVRIATAHTAGGDYAQVAHDHVETLYAYGLASVQSSRRWLPSSSFDQHLTRPFHTLLRQTTLAPKTKASPSKDGPQYVLKT